MVLPLQAKLEQEARDGVMLCIWDLEQLAPIC